MNVSIVAAKAVTSGGIIENVEVRARHGTITAVGPAATDDAATIRGAWVVPGAVDLHVHGGGGGDLSSPDLDEVRAALAFHRANGTTTSLISLVSAPLETLCTQLERIASWLADPATGLSAHVAGIHLEGPFLSTIRCGAIDPDTMIDATPAAVDRLLASAGGWLRVITVAPERPGVCEIIPKLCTAGVRVAIGHTDASVAQCHAAATAGATMATHLGNGMRPFHHRDPGPFGAALVDDAITCEVIADGHHLHLDTLALVAAVKGADGFTVCTDAIAAAGAADGDYPLGARRICVRDGIARLGPDGSLAGSTTTTAASLRLAVAGGIPIDVAVRALASNPARLLGLEDRGEISVGRRADLVVFDDDLELIEVVAGGEVVAR